MEGNERPRLVFWELTTGCNLRCIHCRASATELMSPEDLTLRECREIIDQLAEYAPFILVLSGGEPLWRKDVFDIAKYAGKSGIAVALATNGTLVDEAMAHRIREAGIRRVAISLDGADRSTHDTFRGHNGAFESAVYGLKCLKDLGISTQINTTVSQHNAHQLPDVLELAKSLGVDAFHLFLLVPVGCGLSIAEDQAVGAAEAERILNWFYDRSLDSGLELKATCAPQYYRISRQRRVEAKKAGIELPPAAHVAHPGGAGQAGGDRTAMHQITRGCLAGSAVCFISHLGEVFPCGYLPVAAGNLRREKFRDIWENAAVFKDLRDTGNLGGKCGPCEFRNVCMGCRARAYGVTGDYLAEEPYCIYQPKTMRGEHFHT